MPALLLLAILSSEPPRQRLAMGGFTFVGISPELQRYLPEQLAHALEVDGVRVMTLADAAALLGAERQRQLLGCGEGASCMAELAGALGAGGIVLGSLARLGDSLQLSVKVLAPTGERVLAVHGERVDGDARLLDAIDATARALAAELEPPSHLPAARWVPLAIGGALATGGAAMLGLAFDRHNQLNAAHDPPLSLQASQSLAGDGSTFRAVGLAAIGAGAAAAALGLYFGRDAAAQPVVAAGPGGFAVGVRGEFP